MSELKGEYCKPLFLLDFFVICSSLVIEIMVQKLAIGGLLVIARTWRFARVGHGVIASQEQATELLTEDEAVSGMKVLWPKISDERWEEIRIVPKADLANDKTSAEDDLAKEFVELCKASPEVALRALSYSKAYKELMDKKAAKKKMLGGDILPPVGKSSV